MTADDLSPTPEPVHDLAESCVRFVQAALGVELDFTQDTLPLLDHYLSEAADAEDDVLGLVVPAAGAYFGEVARRHLEAGIWVSTGAKYEEWRLELHPGPVSINPIGIALECISGDSVTGWGSEFAVPEKYRQNVNDAVDALGEVREEDYYTFALRLEVLETVHVRLTALASAGALSAHGGLEDPEPQPN